MKKRFISMILVLVMCASLCAFASAADNMDSDTSPVTVNGTACKIWSTIFENHSKYRAGTWIQTNNNSSLSAGSVKIQSYLYDSTGRLAKSSESILESDYYFHVAYTKFMAASDYAYAGGSVWVKNSADHWIRHDTEETPSYSISRAAMLTSAASTLEDGQYPQNSAGMTYGSLAVADVTGEAPALIAAMGTNGESGYIKKADLLEEYDAAKYDGCVGRFIPLYDIDGNEIGTFMMYFNDTSEIAGMDIDEVREKLADGRSEDPILWDLADKTLVNGAYPTNKNGETYGHPMLRRLVGYLPDLIESTNEDGIHGFTRDSDAPVMTVNADGTEEGHQPMYDKEGNIVGVFQVGGGDSIRIAGKTVPDVSAELNK